jgi:phosphoglycerate dehydrogenase-like enzyme
MIANTALSNAHVNMSKSSLPQPDRTPPASPSSLWWLTATDRARFFPGDAGAHAGGLVLDPTAAQSAETLQARNPEVLVTSWQTPPLPVEWLDDPGCRLRYVCHVGGTVRRWVPRRFLERGGLVTNWGRAVAESVAEHALLLALAALRDLPAWPQGKTGPDGGPRTRTLRGKRVGIHGFGGVPQALVRLLRPFGVEIAAFSAGVPEAVFAAHGVRAASALEELLAMADVFFECEALTPATEGALDASRLARLRDGVVFVNVGRGRLVDEAALVGEARAGRLRVAVDVLQHEPITPASVLCQVPGVIVSPHIAGPTREEYAMIGRRAADNVQRYLRGEPLEDVVTLAHYDRST